MNVRRGKKRGPSRALPPGLLGGVPARNARDGHCKEIPGLAATVSKDTQSYGRRPQRREPRRAVRTLHFCFRGIPFAGRPCASQPAAPVPGNVTQNTTACRLEPVLAAAARAIWLAAHQGPGGCCNPESRYHRSDAIRRRPGRPSFVSSQKIKAFLRAGSWPVQDRPIVVNSPNIICAGFPAEEPHRQTNRGPPGAAPTIESTLRDKEARSRATTGPLGGRTTPPGHLPKTLWCCRSPLRAGSSCIRVCKYPDAHASRRRIETWTESCMRPSETLPLGGTLSPRTPARP